jgi:hypothetical protein
VGRYSQRESDEQQQQQRQRQHQRGEGAGAPGGGAGPAGFDFEEFMRDPLKWFEQEVRRQQQRAERAQQGSYTWGDASARQRHHQQQQQQWQQRGGGTGGMGGGTPRGPSGDPLRYYETLGVSKSCSTQELAAAFRGLALKYHPDRASGEADKAAATKRFQVMWGGSLHVCSHPTVAGQVVLRKKGNPPLRPTKPIIGCPILARMRSNRRSLRPTASCEMHAPGSSTTPRATPEATGRRQLLKKQRPCMVSGWCNLTNPPGAC